MAASRRPMPAAAPVTSPWSLGSARNRARPDRKGQRESAAGRVRRGHGERRVTRARRGNRGQQASVVRRVNAVHRDQQGRKEPGDPLDLPGQLERPGQPERKGSRGQPDRRDQPGPSDPPGHRERKEYKGSKDRRAQPDRPGPRGRSYRERSFAQGNFRLRERAIRRVRRSSALISSASSQRRLSRERRVVRPIAVADPRPRDVQNAAAHPPRCPETRLVRTSAKPELSPGGPRSLARATRAVARGRSELGTESRDEHSARALPARSVRAATRCRRDQHHSGRQGNRGPVNRVGPRVSGRG
jgi:hypothetical protein